jgi:hypothetical protein
MEKGMTDIVREICADSHHEDVDSKSMMTMIQQAAFC